MNRYLILIAAAALGLMTLGAATGFGQAGNSASEVGTIEAPMSVKPDAQGVIKFFSQKGDINEVLRMLGTACHKNIVASPQVKGNVSVNLFDVTCKEILDALLTPNGFAWEEKGNFVFVYTQKELAAMKAAQMKLESRTYKLNYVPAKDAAVLIAPLLSQGGKVTLSPEAGGSTGGKNSGSGESWASGNYIIVIDYAEQFPQIEKVLKEIDRRPMQVLVEATILVAKLNDNCQLGIDFTYLGGVDLSSTGTLNPTGDAGTDSVVKTNFTSKVSPGGLSLGVSSNNVSVLIRALESITDVVTLGNPKVMTLNRQFGKVMVGNRDGFPTTTSTATTQNQTVEYLETGTSLLFRPFVMDDGYIRMELNPKDSDGSVTEKGQFVLPTEDDAEVLTNVLIKDGQTIVIGGLFRESTSLGQTQIPLLGSIPLLGNLFRSSNHNNEREEVIFLITPHIVKEPVDSAAGPEALARANELLLGAREGMLGISRERLANWHYQQALKNQAAGNRCGARWNAWVAAEISPACLEMIQLRHELIGQEMVETNCSTMKEFMRQLLEREKALPAGAAAEIPLVEKTVMLPEPAPMADPPRQTASSPSVLADSVLTFPVSEPAAAPAETTPATAATAEVAPVTEAPVSTPAPAEADAALEAK